MRFAFLDGLANRRVIIGFVLLQPIVFGVAFQLIGQRFIDSPDGDQTLYYNTSRRILSGQCPYRDFPLEYPPLSVAPMLVPWLMSAGEPLGVHGYSRLFALENALLSSATLLVIASILTRLNQISRAIWPKFASYTLLVAIC
ncbi:MAG TPA: hypothetical protein VFV34_10180, partial [Blastocatellia bacterium]|nr:hypothetical protein [Blastocatellia bacterium]